MSAVVGVVAIIPEKTSEIFTAPQTYSEVHLVEMILFHHGRVRCLSSRDGCIYMIVANVFFVMPMTISIAIIAAIIITLIIFACRSRHIQVQPFYHPCISSATLFLLKPFLLLS